MNWRPGEQRGGATIGEWLHAENVVHGAVAATPAERVRAKAVYFGTEAQAELDTLARLGDTAFNRAVADGGESRRRR